MLEKPCVRSVLEDLGTDRIIILKFALEKCGQS
jgi:hypothetical protein